MSSSGKELDLKDLWQPCCEGRLELSQRFSKDEIVKALEHKNSAAGPDGWTYNDICQLKNFPEDFVRGLHWMATNGSTPDSWKVFNSMMLFKKPDDFKPGQEKVLKNFRPIALSNVSYKLLASALCKRLTKWLSMNKGISYSQRAVFGRHGVSENTLIVGEALNARKAVIYLDLSDAFNSVEHSIIFEALRQCRCPEWIIRLIQSMYSGCKTTPTDVNGKVLAGPVPVTRGVKQGCPLSALLFNLILDPVLRAVASNAAVCLGYMDDLAIVIEDPTKAEDILQKVVELTSRLGLKFNAGKCGVANLKQTLQIEGVDIPAVTEDRAYKYLGTEALPTKMEGLEDCFKKAWRIAELIEFSDLTPMQKLHALRIKVYPMLYHLLENSQSTMKQVEKINRDMRRLTKRLLFLPERAACAYLHLHRMYGGPGIPDLVLLKSKMAVKAVVTMLNLDEEFGEYCTKIICAAQSKEDIMTKINDNKSAGCSNTVKSAARALKTLNQYLEVPVKLERLEDQVTLSIDGTVYKNPWPMLNRIMQKQSLKELQKLPNQGRFWKTLSSTPFTTKNIYSFHTPLCDWRQIHKSRLNLVPLRANFFWQQHSDQNCKRCQAGRETLNHVLNNCTTHRRKIIQRHNNIRDVLESSSPRNFFVGKEQRFGNLQPDLILRDDTNLKAHILDVKVSAECDDTFRCNNDFITSKYEPLRRAYSIGGYDTRVHTIQFGCLGGVARGTMTSLLTIFRSKRIVTNLLRKCTQMTTHLSRNLIVEHLTGFSQNY